MLLNVPTQLATYTVDAHGNLTTASTSSNMPTTLINNVYDMKMSPSGKLLAVGGVEGLQVFHFNGASPATHYTGLLNNVLITQFFWDNDNHLYAISPSAGKLFVYTVAPSSVSQAPGSPYNITSPQNVIVQTLSVLVQ
jgi:outer membrane protein assembly factor BamB